LGSLNSESLVNPMESKRRSFLKVISWRTTATLTTMLISFLITGNIDMALKIGVFEVIAKIALQYFHERIWTKVTFGLKPMAKDYQI
jgi:adenylylsulfate kinase